MPNRLSEETSPYLLQHAGNPVDWYPWSEEALFRARSEDKPILLSIGYSACHWCHVMERESFEDPETAARMNDGFVCIKVDREERPDLDSIYMRAVQATTGGGGWPLTAFLTPDGRYFYGGTYFPPEPRYGMPSFPQLLAAVLDAYRNRRDEVEEGADRILGLLRGASPAQAGSRIPAAAIRRPEDGVEESGPEARLAALGPSVLRQAALTLAGRFDPLHGGFGPAPKFPQPATLEFLLRYHVRSGEPRALDMALTTLRAMARGGIRDHLGGGFHRYSVDDRWLVPHFEKMLYDNGLLARVYLHAFQISGEEELRDAVTTTLDYLLDDLLDPGGGFYSARDADSEGEEGVFYLWTPDQIRSVLGQEEADGFCRIYGVTDGGNFEGRNILNLSDHLPAAERGESLMGRTSTPGMAAAKKALREARSRRVGPFRDEKVLAAWNSFALRALAEAGRVLGREDYLEAATRTAEFLLGALGRTGGLYRSWKEGRARVSAFLEDYAGLGNALLALHESTLEPRWLLESKQLLEQMLDLFWEDGEGRFYDTPRDGEVLVVRPRDVMDNATPSGNSLAVELLLRAHAVFGLPRFRDIALRCLIHELESMARIPSAFGELLSALDRALDPPLEVVLLEGETGGPGVRELLAAVHRDFLPSRVVVGGGPGLLGRVPLLEGRDPVGGMATAYVCRGLACSLPIHDPRELVSELNADGPGGRRPQAKPSLDGEA